MTFINKDTGAEYEIDHARTSPLTPDIIVIRPVKVEPKWEVQLQKPMHRDFKQNIAVLLNVGEDQAQLMKECCEEMMRVITETDGNLIGFPPTKLIANMMEARQAMKGQDEMQTWKKQS